MCKIKLISELVDSSYIGLECIKGVSRVCDRQIPFTNMVTIILYLNMHMHSQPNLRLPSVLVLSHPMA